VSWKGHRLASAQEHKEQLIFCKCYPAYGAEAGSGDCHTGRGHGEIFGGGFNGTHAAEMIGDADNESALVIEMGADAVDIGKTIHPHPRLIDRIGMAAEVAHDSCTDVPPARK
jgi:hypothetical protein